MTAWKLVPCEPTETMVHAGEDVGCPRPFGKVYRAMLAAAPEPPHISMTKAEAAVFQDWKGMDGAIAFHLIERHANGWGDTQQMMEAWLTANAAPSNVKFTG